MPTSLPLTFLCTLLCTLIRLRTMCQIASFALNYLLYNMRVYLVVETEIWDEKEKGKKKDQVSKRIEGEGERQKIGANVKSSVYLYTL